MKAILILALLMWQTEFNKPKKQRKKARQEQKQHIRKVPIFY